MKELIIPQALKQGDTITSITLSYGAVCEINPVAKKVSILESGVREREVK